MAYKRKDKPAPAPVENPVADLVPGNPEAELEAQADVDAPNQEFAETPAPADPEPEYVKDLEKTVQEQSKLLVAQRLRVSFLEGELAKVQTELDSCKTRLVEQGVDGEVEIVALPPAGMVAPRIVLGNNKWARDRVDEDGYKHYFVSVQLAKSLVSMGNGLKYVLVGPMEYLEETVYGGRYNEKKRFPRHVFRKLSSGATTWIPVTEE